MKPAKSLALIVPAGLLLGMAAGAVNRPVMIQRAQDYWPASVEEARNEAEIWRPIYEGGPQDLMPARYSYRPALDYEALAWPEQGEVDIDSLAAVPSYDQEAPVMIHRGTTESAASEAQAAADDAIAVAAEVDAAPTEVAVADLPPVPPPVSPIVTEAF